MDYIRLYTTEAAYDTDRGNDYREPWVSFTLDPEELNYNMTEEERKYYVPLTFEITGNGNIKWGSNSTQDFAIKTIEYKKNDGEWTSITSTTAGTVISVVAGDVIQFRGDNTQYGTNVSSRSSFSGSTCQFTLRGNIMSLINKESFGGLRALPSTHTFNSLFCCCAGLTDASNLLLPATTLKMACYQGMFSGCTNLTTTPQLPATTLVSYCYDYMFRNCAKLTTAPQLPAPTLMSNSYSQMFRGCTLLNHIKCLATNISASNCLTNWVDGVASTGTFVKDASMTSWPTGTAGIPTNWTVQDAS